MRSSLLLLLLLGCGGTKPAPEPVAVEPADAATRTPADAAPVCVFDGVGYAEGELIPRGDDCNSCRCHAGHKTACTMTICDLIIVDRVTFARGSSRLPSSADTLLDTVADVLARHTELALTLVGHTTPDEPTALALDRAQVVVDALIARGVDPARLSAVGRGAREPLGRKPDDDRRVELAPRNAP